MARKKIAEGIYLVIDPGMNPEEIYRRLYCVRDEKMAAVQIWDNPALDRLDRNLLAEIVKIFEDTSVPVLINNQWDWLEEIEFDGVHFDDLPTDTEKIFRQIGSSSVITGLTLTNDLTVVKEAEAAGVDYFSFCSVFPSGTSNSCEIVRPETIRECREITDLPVFLAGGITPENLERLSEWPFDGIAVISGIMKAADPREEWRRYSSKLKRIKQSKDRNEISYDKR